MGGAGGQIRPNGQDAVDYNNAPVDKVNLTNHFLIAMPGMADPNFSRTLTYICEHNAEGALGVVVNRPMDMTLSGLFGKLNLEPGPGDVGKAPVYFGGPVQTEQGFVLHHPVGEWKSTMPIREQLGLTTSRDILEAVSAGGGPDRFLVTLGYSGWGAGQIENELRQNAWLTVEASDAIIFDLPAEKRLPAAMGLLGLDYARLSDEAGHA